LLAADRVYPDQGREGAGAIFLRVGEGPKVSAV